MARGRGSSSLRPNIETLLDINWLRSSLNRRLSYYVQTRLALTISIFRTKLELEKYLVYFPIKERINFVSFDVLLTNFLLTLEDSSILFRTTNFAIPVVLKIGG